METTFIQKIQENKASHYWYGGKVVEIKHKGFTFSIKAVGDMYATLFDENNVEIAYIKDKNNGGWFDNEMSRYIKNDEMLYDLIDKNKIVFDFNNWWECFVIDDKGYFNDLMWSLDCINIYDAIEEVKNSIDDVIKDIKGE